MNVFYHVYESLVSYFPCDQALKKVTPKNVFHVHSRVLNEIDLSGVYDLNVDILFLPKVMFIDSK